MRKPAKKQSAPAPMGNPVFNKTCELMKNELRPTVLKNFSYKQGQQVFNINDAKIKSIGKNKKHLAFLITGNPSVVDEKKMMSEYEGAQSPVE